MPSDNHVVRVAVEIRDSAGTAGDRGYCDSLQPGYQFLKRISHLQNV
jgi:hypothetical protein